MTKELWLIWRQPKTRRRYKVGTLINEDNCFDFVYTNPELDEAMKAGFRCFPGFDDIQKKYHSKELFANIETRLPNTARPDYNKILKSLELDLRASKWDILKATKGRLITDSYEFVAPFDKNKIEFDIAGTRYCDDIEKCKENLKVNEELFLKRDKTNEYDENAVKIIYKKDKQEFQLGYVPRYYSKYLSSLLDQGVPYLATIKKINFESNLNDEDIMAYVKLIFNE